MEDQTRRDRLEQELRFLKESFEAEIISKEEYEKGKDRIERKLSGIQHLNTKSEVNEVNENINEPNDISDNNNNSYNNDNGKKEQTGIEIIMEPKTAEKARTFHKDEIPESKDSESKDGSFAKAKFFNYLMIVVVLFLVMFFSYSFLNNPNSPKIEENGLNGGDIKDKDVEVRLTDKNLEEIGSVAVIKTILKTNVVVLNNKEDCFNCDPERVLGILENWFGSLNVQEIDYNTTEGRELASELDTELLPVYILEESIKENPAFDQLKKSFIQKDDKYILSQGVSSPNFYIKRENMPVKLDFFMISGDGTSKKAEQNLGEFLKIFRDVKFEKHSPNDELTKELGIKTYPSFLVNNKVKFSGVHSAETIKNNFCKVNDLKDCEIQLTSSLI